MCYFKGGCNYPLLGLIKCHQNIQRIVLETKIWHWGLFSSVVVKAGVFCGIAAYLLYSQHYCPSGSNSTVWGGSKRRGTFRRRLIISARQGSWHHKGWQVRVFFVRWLDTKCGLKLVSSYQEDKYRNTLQAARISKCKKHPNHVLSSSLKSYRSKYVFRHIYISFERRGWRGGDI